MHLKKNKDENVSCQPFSKAISPTADKLKLKKRKINFLI